MMPCDARLYEETSKGSHAPLSSTAVQLIAVDQATLANLCAVQNNAATGVHLAFAAQSITYQVAVNDAARVYAGFTVLNLNGDVPGDLDLIVHKLPTGGRVPSASSANAARTAVMANGIWSPEEKLGVLGLMGAYAALRPSVDPVIRKFVDDYGLMLDRLGVDPLLL